jgi:hypothetical protein
MKKDCSPEVIRGKTIREWSKELKLSIPRIYQLKRTNQLEARIDGTWKPPEKKIYTYFGKSIKEWSEHFNTKEERIRYLIKNKKLKLAIEIGDFKKLSGRIVQGKNLAQWAKELGITRERARQLANKNLLIERINQLKK